MSFLMSSKIQRYQDLYNKFYIGYMSVSESKDILNLEEDDYDDKQKVVVAIEKKHSNEIVLTYYIQKTRKNLYLYSFNDDGSVVKEKKDPFGITVTEVYHTNKMMDESYELSTANIKVIKKLLKERFVREEKPV